MSEDCCRTCKYWVFEDFEDGFFIGKCEVHDILTTNEYFCDLYESIFDENILKHLKEK